MKPPKSLNLFAALFLSLVPHAVAEQPWRPIFNGKNLDGWTPKIAGHALGVNYADTFRVEDGILKVSYDGYEKFGKQFGHLFTNFSYSRYILRMEYRFIGEKVTDAPGYGNLNSGLMVHSQPPQSMLLDQGFPASLEFQFLADEGKGKRSTANLCTPGTHVEMGGKLIVQHIVESAAPTFPADDWITMEIEVRGNEEIIHRINGTEVLRYQHPQLDPECNLAPVKDILGAGVVRMVSSGHIALQAEGQPIWFRKIELRSLETP